jgi:hypothetical protein
MRTNHARDQRTNDLTGPGRQLSRFQMHVNFTAHSKEGFNQIRLAGRQLPVQGAGSPLADRYLMKITRPKVHSDVNSVHAEVLLSLNNQVLEMAVINKRHAETSVRE